MPFPSWSATLGRISDHFQALVPAIGVFQLATTNPIIPHIASKAINLKNHAMVDFGGQL
jgi:hypothetical protein